MANWAIVIGIDEYWDPEFALTACVKDAIKITEWLLDPNGGKVSPQNLYLMTRPTQQTGSVVGPVGIQRYDATFDLLVTVTDNLMTRSGGKGERLFFYFSGHGITNTSGTDAEEALVMADFTETLTNKAVEFRSLVEFFRGTRFSQQFFIVDACRDVLDWGKKFRTSPFTSVGQIDPNLPQVQQYTLLATSPRIKAVAIGDKSAFTEELLSGLKGKGSSKILDGRTGEYVIHTSRLFKFVESQILSRKINVSDDPNNPILQKPRINGEHGSEDPELARLTAKAVTGADLSVFVDPNPAPPQAEVTIVDQFGVKKATIKPITKAPETLSLQPMIYTARVSAPGYVPEPPLEYFELYDAKELGLRLVPGSDQLALIGEVVSEAREIFEVDVEGVDLAEVSTKGLSKKKKRSRSGRLGADEKPQIKMPPRLTVEASDPLARLEVADSQGKPLRAGQGTISTSDLSPGFYRARLVAPEGQVERIIHLSPGDDLKVTLEAPLQSQSPLLKAITSSAKFTVFKDNALDVSETVGPMASAQLSTVLALTGSVINQDEKWGHRLRSLGLKSFKESVASNATSGIQIFFVVDSGDSQRGSTRLAGTKVRLWPIDESKPAASTNLTSESEIAGLYELAQAVEPGHYLLSISPEQGAPVVFAVAVLPGRLTMLLLQYDSTGQFDVFQYNFSLSHEQFKKLNHKHVRQFDLAQRFYLSGRLDYALETAGELLHDKWADPLAVCLGGYLLLRLGKPGELSVAANNMLEFYEQLCDSHVLKAEYEASKGNSQAAAEFSRQALDHGVPVFAEGLTRLADAIRTYKLEDHARAKLIMEMTSKRARGFLWTAWIPSKEVSPADSQIQISIVDHHKEIQGDEMIAGGHNYKVEGDLIMPGRDSIKVTGGNVYQNRTVEQTDAVDHLFDDLNRRSRSLTDADAELVGSLIEKMRGVTRRIQQGGDSREAEVTLESCIRALMGVAPDIGKMALKQLSDPAAELAPKTRDIAQKLQVDRRQ
jgi:hypothetical protein